MSQARNKRRIAKKTAPAVDKIEKALQQIGVVAEGLTIAHNGIMSVIRDLKRMRSLLHEVARRTGMSDEEIQAYETEQPSGGTEG
jgi:hypothetical protein